MSWFCLYNDKIKKYEVCADPQHNWNIGSKRIESMKIRKPLIYHVDKKPSCQSMEIENIVYIRIELIKKIS